MINQSTVGKQAKRIPDITVETAVTGGACVFGSSEILVVQSLFFFFFFYWLCNLLRVINVDDITIDESIFPSQNVLRAVSSFLGNANQQNHVKHPSLHFCSIALHFKIRPFSAKEQITHLSKRRNQSSIGQRLQDLTSVTWYNSTQISPETLGNRDVNDVKEI